MNIIFIATTGVYQALIAANLYMGKLDDDYRQLPYFSNFDLEQSGKPLYLGNDPEGNQVYALGVGPDIDMVYKCLSQLRTILNAAEEDLHLVPISIKSQQVILLLHKIFKSGYLRAWSVFFIIYLLKRDLPLIADQLRMERDSK